MDDFFGKEFDPVEDGFDMFGPISDDNVKNNEEEYVFEINPHWSDWVGKDGTLSLMKKGDLFRKKIGHIFKQEQFDIRTIIERNKNLFFGELFKKYIKMQAISSEVFLDGNEFTLFPPTAAGRDAYLAGLLRAMQTRDTLRKTKENEELRTSLEEVLSIYFRMMQIDETTGKSIGEGFDVSWNHEFEEAKSRYMNLFPREELAATQRSFRRESIVQSNLSDYIRHIPTEYAGKIAEGSLFAEAYFDEEDELSGVVVYSVIQRWKEMVWLSLGEHYRKKADVAILLSKVVSDSKESGKYRGFFIEFSVDMDVDELKKAFVGTGMYIHKQKNNVYEALLSDIHLHKSMVSASKKVTCVPTAFLSDNEKNIIEDLMKQSSTPIPIDFPIQWDRYREDLSVAYLNDEHDLAGLLLVRDFGEALVVDLLYAGNSVMVAALIGTAMINADGFLSADTKVVMAIANESVTSLVNLMMPGAKRDDIVQAVTWFD